MKKIVLASASSGRKRLMRFFKIPFIVRRAQVEELSHISTCVEDLVRENALIKARDVVSRIRGEALVIGADTVVYAGQRLVLKPANLREARETLKMLMSSPHWVYTGVVVMDARSGKFLTEHEQTKVFMTPQEDKAIDRYHREVSPLDKAGGFDIEGRGALFIPRIEGCYYNVVGLPLARLAGMLKKFGVPVFMLVMMFMCSGCFFGDVPAKACLRGQCYKIEMAKTPQSREKGLMFRERLDTGHGMLFFFDEPGKHGFWMKNMAFPIDILWLGEDKKIVHIESNVPPCQQDPCVVYVPKKPAAYVLEIQAGEARRRGIVAGDFLNF